MIRKLSFIIIWACWCSEGLVMTNGAAQFQPQQTHAIFTPHRTFPGFRGWKIYGHIFYVRFRSFNIYFVKDLSRCLKPLHIYASSQWLHFPAWFRVCTSAAGARNPRERNELASTRDSPLFNYEEMPTKLFLFGFCFRLERSAEEIFRKNCAWRVATRAPKHKMCQRFGKWQKRE